MKRIISVALVALLLLSLCACVPPEKAIVGTWTNQKTVLGVVTETKYVFNADGTGTRTTILEMGFTYEISGDKLAITTETLGIKNTEEYTFIFEDGKLILTNSLGSLELEKAK